MRRIANEGFEAMQFRTKLLFLTILPVVLISLAALVLINLQSERLAREQRSVVENLVRKSKETELKNYVNLARTAIAPFVENAAISDEIAQTQVISILQKMTFGEDGYFFVYQEDGTNVMHPRLPELVGRNWIDLQDPNGKSVIRDLIELAKSRGDFYQYVWDKPSTRSQKEKLGHSIYLDEWDWMIGSGIYLDDVGRQIATVQATLDENLQETRWVLLALSCSAVLLTALCVSFFRFTEQKFADERLKQLAAQVVDAQELERKRLSSELHDGVSQLLVSARYGLDNARSVINEKSGIKAIDKSSDALSHAISEIRRVCKALRPTILDDMGLATALNSLASDFTTQTGIKVICDTDQLGALVGEREKTTLYRVAQEAFTNIAKHSGAKQVHLSLVKQSRRVELRIVDDGVGMQGHNGRRNTGGSGIRNMKERLRSHGGDLVLKNGQRAGLALVAHIPLTKRDTLL